MMIVGKGLRDLFRSRKAEQRIKAAFERIEQSFERMERRIKQAEDFADEVDDG